MLSPRLEKSMPQTQSQKLWFFTFGVHWFRGLALTFVLMLSGCSETAFNSGSVAASGPKPRVKAIPIVYSYKSPLVPKKVEGQLSKPVDQPNIILVNLDDGDRDTVEVDFRGTQPQPLLPNITALANSSFRFSNCHVAVPICGPSRACLMTGQYAYKTGVRCNRPADPFSRGVAGGYLPFRYSGPFGSSDQLHVNNEIGFWMRSAGYHTMMVGKFLHDDFVPQPGETWDDVYPPGWERFFPSLGSRYFNTHMIKDGVFLNADDLDTEKYPNSYRTAVETVDALNLIEEHMDQNDGRPFFMYLAPLAPHVEAVEQRDPYEVQFGKGMVDPAYKSLLPDLKQLREGDFNETNVEDKPEAMRNLLPLRDDGSNYNTNDVMASDMEYRRRVLSMKSVDDQIRDLMNKLRDLEIDQNTIIIFTSDNGYQLGQQRHFGKAVPYDRVTNVPLYVWGPGYFDNGPDFLPHLISQIDIVPTILEMVGAPVPPQIQGKSFLPLLDGRFTGTPNTWRPNGVLIEHWERLAERNRQEIEATFQTVRFYDASYTEWANGDREYYKLTNDRLQLVNKFATIPEAFKTVLANRLSLLKADMPFPKSAIEKPFTSQDVFYQSAELKGLAEFSREIAEVRLQITDITNPNQMVFWNGTDWTEQRTHVLAHLDSHETVITNWSYDFRPEPNAERKYRLVARAVATSGAVEQDVGFKDFFIDVDQPVTMIASPLANQTEKYFKSLTLTGTAEDDLGIRAVRMAILNPVTQKYWNGTAWQAGYIMVNTELSHFGRPQVTWNYTLSPPEKSGNIVAYIRAVSLDGRFDRTPRIHRFSWSQ